MIETRQILEELQLKNVLATSSTGAIFLAGDPETGEDVVIKMVSCAVPNAEEKVRELFLEMVEAARSDSIPTMPRLTDHGLTPEGDGFVVMDLVEGITLDTVEDLTPFASINILLDVLSTIEGLAAAGTAHLNLKPTNILLTNAPAYDRAVVLGFGTSATLLHAGAGVPVPAVDPHLAPELVSGNLLPQGERWRSDLFSFGVIACGALGAEIEADGYERPRVTLPPPVRSALPEAVPLEKILGRIMEPDPVNRAETPSDVRDPLIRALPDPPAVAASPQSASEAVPPEPGAFDPNQTDPAFEPQTVEPVAAAPAPSPELPSSAGHASGTEEPFVATDEDGWPEVLFDDPELPASLDETEDTDVRNPIPEDVWVPEVDTVVHEVPKAKPVGITDDAARRVSRTELALVAAVVVVLVAIVTFTWPTGGDESSFQVAGAAVIPASEPPETLVPPPEDDNLFDDLLGIQQLVDGGDLDGARSALDDLGDRVGRSMSSDEGALYDSLVSAVAQASDRDSAIDDLRTGLSYGSIKMLRRGAAGLSGLSRDEIAEIRGLGSDLEHARRALRLHAEMWDASRDGDHLAVISAAAELERALPGYSGAPEAREESAAVLEARAEVLAADHKYGDAIAVLEGLDRVWPGRQGVTGRIAWCREQIDLTRRGESVIADALARGDQGDPERGLEILDSMAPDPRMQDDVDRARVALQNRLAELDAGEPIIEYATAMELAFKKNATLTVPLRISDDYRVEKVVVHARNESDDGYLQIPLVKSDDGMFHFTVDPQLHGNKDVAFYVVARDHSGHVGSLGSRDEPEVIMRKKWFKKRR
jgi:serine/threonine protein kinase